MPDRFASGKVTNAFENRVESKFADKQDQVCQKVEQLGTEWKHFIDVVFPKQNEILNYYIKQVNENDRYLIPRILAAYNIIVKIIFLMIKHPFFMWLNYKVFKLYNFSFKNVILPDGKHSAQIVVEDIKYFRDKAYKAYRIHRKNFLADLSKKTGISTKDIDITKFLVELYIDNNYQIDITDPLTEVFRYD